MKHTAEQALEVARTVEPGLVSADAWRRVSEAAAYFPATMMRGFYLECRLAAQPAPVDWIVRVEKQGRDIVAGRNPAQRLPEALRADPVWERLARFCAAWADDPLLDRVVDHAWLEFDLGGAPGSIPRPSVFTAFGEGAVEGLDPAGRELLLDRLLELLVPGSPARRAAQAALRAAPAGAKIPYLGFMLARPSRAVRLYLGSPDAAALPGQLGAMGWPGAPGELSALLERFGGLPAGAAPDISMVHLDVDGEVLPRVGIEYRFRRAPQLRGSLVEAAFLDLLVEQGLCTAAKRDGLLAWPGHSVRTMRHELWRSVVARRVNCIKLLHAPRGAPEAKGYLLSEWTPLPGPRPGLPGERANPASIG